MSQCEEWRILLCRMTVVSIASSFAYDFFVASSAVSGQNRSRPQELIGPWSEVSLTQLKMSLFSMTCPPQVPSLMSTQARGPSWIVLPSTVTRRLIEICTPEVCFSNCPLSCM